MRHTRSVLALLLLAFLPRLAHAVETDLRVEEAVRLALTRNERAKISDANVVVSDAAVLRARTAFYPTVLALGTYTQRPDDVTAPGRNSYSLLASVTVNQPILTIPSYALYDQARHNYDGQVAQTVDDKRLLAYDAVRAFFAALSADEVVSAADERLKTAQANVDDTSERAKAQLVSVNDVSRATIDLGNAVNELANDRGTAQVAYVNLAFTLNASIAPTTKLARPDGLLAAAQVAPPSLDALLRTALARRPDLASKRHLAVAAHDFAREPMLRLIPTLGIAGTFQLTSDPTLPGGSFYNNEFLTLTLSWPIFDAGVRYADKRSRDALATIADLTVDALLRTVDAQVRSAAEVLVAAQAALIGAAQARDAAKQSQGETEILYKQGLAKAIELVDANDSRFLAEVNYSTSEYAVALAYLGLRQAIGLDPLGTELR